MYTSSDISMTIAGRQTAPHAARLIGSGLSRRPTEDSAAQLRGVCTPGRIRTRVLLQLESNTTCSRDLHGSKSKCMQANKEEPITNIRTTSLGLLTPTTPRQRARTEQLREPYKLSGEPRREPSSR